MLGPMYCNRPHWRLAQPRFDRCRYLSGVVPGVVFASSGAEGFSRPGAFSGVLDLTPVGPGPAVDGLSPRYPEACVACRASARTGPAPLPAGVAVTIGPSATPDFSVSLISSHPLLAYDFFTIPCPSWEFGGLFSDSSCLATGGNSPGLLFTTCLNTLSVFSVLRLHRYGAVSGEPPSPACGENGKIGIRCALIAIDGGTPNRQRGPTRMS
jgi:hypothetical protein